MTALASDPIREVLAHLPDARKSGKGWTAKCPAHEDRHASLSVNVGDDGRALLKCHAGCTAEMIVAKMGMKLSDLFVPHESHRGNGAARKIVAEYAVMQNSNATKLLSRAEAAGRIGVSKAALEAWAHRGKPALPYIRCGGAVRYRESDIEHFLASRTATSAAEHATAQCCAVELAGVAR